jgi:WXG100 family type VII secretion target
MSGRIGIDKAQMDQLRSKFEQQANTVQQLTSDLQGQVDTIIGTGWEGNAARKFQDAWNTEFKSALTKLNEALLAAGKEVANRKQAMEQLDAG